MRLRAILLAWALVMAAVLFGLAAEPTLEVIIVIPPSPITVASCHGLTCTG
jgi:hypothetical protein